MTCKKCPTWTQVQLRSSSPQRASFSASGQVGAAKQEMNSACERVVQLVCKCKLKSRTGERRLG